jgi:predicted ATP-dependent Lon-type protease
MPAYGTNPVAELCIGDQITLSNASLGGPVLTQQVALGIAGTGNPANVTVFNFSAATLTVYVAYQDTGVAAYIPLSAGGTNVTVPAASAVSFSTTAAFLALLPNADPGALAIVVKR